MKFDADRYIVFKKNERFDFNYVNEVIKKYPNAKILIEIANTKGLKAADILRVQGNVAFRVAGAYDDRRLQKYAKESFGDETAKEYYYESVIYSKSELLAIVKELDKIDAGIKKEWTEIQKVVYIYNRLKRGIMYDPKYETLASKDIRSLRGLITRNTVCAGYALIFKELMDRNGIKCEFTRGGTQKGKGYGHAWNIIEIKGKKYPIDLTWDNTQFRSGKGNTFDWLTKTPKEFAANHFPNPLEDLQDYEHILSRLDPTLIENVVKAIGINRAVDYQTTTYSGTRKDGTRYLIAQVGDCEINGEMYYRYYYQDINKDRTFSKPLILYGKTNITRFVDKKRFKEPIPDGYEDAIDNVLFSKENIQDSLNKKTYFIGSVKKKTTSNKLELAANYREIEKDPEVSKNLSYLSKWFTRSDGSTFIAQQMWKEPTEIAGVKVMRYDIFETVKEDGMYKVKRNTVYTERNFFLDNRQDLRDDYLSRSRLDRKFDEAGGYIGYYNEEGYRVFNPDLVRYFETSTPIDIEREASKSKQEPTPAGGVKPSLTIPTFSELKILAANYEVYIDSNDILNAKPSEIKIREIKTGKIVDDFSIRFRAMFANLWLKAAGIRNAGGEVRSGYTYAFNVLNEKLYNVICNKLTSDAKTKGVIDTVNLFKTIEEDCDVDHCYDVIVGLFRTDFQTNVLNKLFLTSVGKERSITATPLYTMEHAINIAYGKDDGAYPPKQKR